MDKQKIVTIVIVAVFVILAIIYFFYNNNTYEEIEIDNIVNSNNVQNYSVETKTIKVYVTGEVNLPGVVEINDGDRIEDAIEKAGGLTEDANLKDINLAYEVDDGDKIYIPNKNEVSEGESESSNTSNSGKININKATSAELMSIPGVGESTANKIISYRETNGKFSSIEDLKKVSGIGDAKYESIKEYISVK